MADKDGERMATEVEALTGWKPPVMYDLVSDTTRLATQEDVDGLIRALNVAREMVTHLRRAIECADRLRNG